MAYAGRYSFLGDHVIHHVELSLFPNWVGSDQERFTTGDARIKLKHLYPTTHD